VTTCSCVNSTPGVRTTRGWLLYSEDARAAAFSEIASVAVEQGVEPAAGADARSASGYCLSEGSTHAPAPEEPGHPDRTEC
jgi:hypothetical protein